MRCACGQKAVPGYRQCYPCWSDALAKAAAVMTPENKARIDAMSREDMASLWRFAAVGDPLLQGVTGQYFATVFADKGGMSLAISKSLGWEKT